MNKHCNGRSKAPAPSAPRRRERPRDLLFKTLAVWLFTLVCLWLPASLTAATITVGNTRDSGPGSLRQAIQIAASGDTINFSVSGTIRLTSGELLVTNDLVIAGPEAGSLVISGNTNSRVFQIRSNATVTISDLTIREGHAADGVLAGSGANGGGLLNSGMLTMVRCTVSGNTGGNGGYGAVGGSGGAGGGIYNVASLKMTSCTVAGNESGMGGRTGAFGRSGGSGGGIFNAGDCTLTACTVCNNQAGNGGLGYQGGPGGSGGGIYNATNASRTKLHNTLVALNSVGHGGRGILGGDGLPGTGPNLFGWFGTQGNNLIGQTNGSFGIANGLHGDRVGPINPLVSTLQDNGGSAFTMALLPGSPAIDAGDDTLLKPPYDLATDQRGMERKAGSHVDIGAFELQGPSMPMLVGSPTRLGDGSLRFAFTNTPDWHFTVLATTNESLRLSNWTVLGCVVEISPGVFLFTDSQATNFASRYYRLRSP